MSNLGLPRMGLHPKIICFNHEENYEGLSREDILKLSYPLYDSLETFLNKLLYRKVPYDILDMGDD